MKRMDNNWQPKKEEDLAKEFAKRVEQHVLWGTPNKYFVPEISDLRIGYEMEGKIYDEDKWIKIIINTADWAKHICNVDVTNDIYTLPKDIYRVPYLTKEQIEAEGWKYVNIDSCWTKNGMEFYFLDNHKINILRQPEFLFQGECKSVNEFRFICKLLKI